MFHLPRRNGKIVHLDNRRLLPEREFVSQNENGKGIISVEPSHTQGKIGMNNDDDEKQDEEKMRNGIS